MLSLVENHLGFDATALGFPSVHSCHAIVYQTKQGLYGFHSFGGAMTEQFQPRAKAFAAFVQQEHITHSLYAIKLYSVITGTNRYNTGSDRMALWLAELREIASALRFTGEIYRGRLTEHLGDHPSAYVRFDVKGDGCLIRYKRWSKMDLTPDRVPMETTSALAHMKQKSGQADTTRGIYTYENEPKTGPVSRVFRKGTNLEPGDPSPDEGNLHTLSNGDLELIKIY